MNATPTNVANFATSTFGRYRRELHRYLMRRLRQPQDVDDLAQEVYLRLIKLSDETIVEKPLPYLYGVASHVLADHMFALKHTPVDWSKDADDCLESPACVLPDDLAVIQMNKEAEDLQIRLNVAEPLPDAVDASAISAKLNEARRVNRLIDDWEAQRARKANHQREADASAKQSDQLTAQLAELLRAKQDAILKAQLPIDGLGFADDHVTLHGSPWPQASEAQRIDASMAIAMAHQPKLRTILIRHASGVGTKIRERIRERAHERGYRVIMEIYDETGANSHVFVEDGLVKKIDGQDVPVVEQAPEPAAVERAVRVGQ